MGLGAPAITPATYRWTGDEFDAKHTSAFARRGLGVEQPEVVLRGVALLADDLR